MNVKRSGTVNLPFFFFFFFLVDWGNGCLGDGGGDAPGQEILGEGDGLFRHGGGRRAEQRRRKAEREPEGGHRCLSPAAAGTES